MNPASRPDGRHGITSRSTERPLGRLAPHIQKLYGWYLRHSFVAYQPRIDGAHAHGGVRPTVDRWKLLRSEIRPHSSLLDIGCGEGFFTLLSARDLQCFSLGIDADRRRLAFAQHQLLSQEISGAGFAYGECTRAFVSQLPTFDYVILLSVFHHMTVRYGLEEATGVLQELRAHTRSALFFETGLSVERTRTTAKLPDMGPDPVAWIRQLFLSAGWSNVEVLGESASYARDAQRPIFKVSP